MSIFKPRTIKFEKLIELNEWRFKQYSISYDSSKIDQVIINTIQSKLEIWLTSSDNYNFPIYKIGTLIIHKWVGGHFAIISWWIDENMLQLFVYLATKENPTEFKLFSDKGIVTCIWEMEIHWFERNAWIDEVLKKEINETTINKYLMQHYNMN